MRRAHPCILLAGYVVVLLLVLTCGWPLSAQPLPPLDEYRLRPYGHAEGLSSVFVQRIQRGGDGYLYVLNEEGITRFDGEVFERIPMPGWDGGASGWRKDAEGQLWVWFRSGPVGVVHEGRFHHVPPFVRSSSPIATADGAMWVKTTERLLRLRFDGAAVDTHHVPYPAEVPSDSVKFLYDNHLDGAQFWKNQLLRHIVRVRARPDGDVRFEPLPLQRCNPGERASVFIDAHNVWLAGPGGVCHIVEDTSVPVDPDTLTLDAFAWGPGRHYIRRARQGEAWMGTYVDDAIRRAVGNVEWFEGHEVTQFLHVPDAQRRPGRGTWWVVLMAEADEAGTLVRLRDGQARRLALRDVLDFHQIIDISSDHEGNLWVGTDQGIVQVMPRRAAVLPPGPYLAEGYTTAIVQTRDEAVWVGTWGGGVHRYAQGRVTRHYTTASGLPSAMIRALHESADGTLWVGTDLGVAMIREGQVRAYPLPGFSRQVRSFAEAPDGTLWIAEQDHLFRLAPDGSLTEVLDGFWTNRSIWAVHRTRDGMLWVGTERGLFHVEDGQAHAIDEAAGTYVVSIHEEEDRTLWLGTFRRGLMRFRPTRDGTGGRFATLTTADGLHSDGIWRVLPDRLGGFWLSSNQGLAYLPREALHAAADAAEAGRPGELRPLVFTEAEGMPSSESNRADPAGWRLTDGRLVFNNLRGLVVIDPAEALRPPPPPPVALHDITADGQPVALEGDTRLPPGTRHVSFDFASLSFTAPAQNRYRYRLDGYDTEWVDGGRQPSATYTNLPPGDYTFRVQSASGPSTWGEPTVQAFEMQPFVWQTAWFRLIAALAVVGALAFAYRFRVRQLLREERIRLRIASDLHDDVGSNLSSIALLSEIVRERGAASDAAEGQLQRLHETATETVGALRDIIWLVDPAHDTVEDLVRKMRRVARDLLNGTVCTFELDADATERVLDVVLIRALFLIYKEALHNVAKHASATRVDVALRLDERHLALVVRDDGVGIDGAANERGHGLGSMARRAEEAGGTLAVRALPGGGTEVRFEARIA